MEGSVSFDSAKEMRAKMTEQVHKCFQIDRFSYEIADPDWIACIPARE